MQELYLNRHKQCESADSVSTEERAGIERALDEKYTAVAQMPEGRFRYPTGEEGLFALGYDAGLVAALPAEVRRFFVGVGNPLARAAIRPGERVLDLGSGAGVDALLAALLVGETGAVLGVERSVPMLDRALANRRLCGAEQVHFLEGSVERLPVPDASFDVAISNGVLNLVVDKRAALAEIFRALKPGGRLSIADQMLVGEAPADRAARLKSWFT